MSEEIQGYPLTWPVGKPRTKFRTRARFKTSFAKAREQLLREIELLGGTRVVFSSNIPRKSDGLPYANSKPANGDPGIAAYFMRKQKQLCFACDCYSTVDDNMHAIALTVGALRGIARWGTGDMMESAFTGFAALPAPGHSSVAWYTVLGVSHDANRDTALEAYRALVKKHHPDLGGDSEMIVKINAAWEQYEKVSQ